MDTKMTVLSLSDIIIILKDNGLLEGNNNDSKVPKVPKDLGGFNDEGDLQ